ncbi:uncharacterized protein LOC21396483 [Morus notabilis]|uniref:uncharacterized protein LOC21396483 n=1 Tax=Morus notabilis TaxID=981085 RepID=UPI000CED46E1|nr:uncharacterized protein LOC21396483 [Morus notabilis]
MIGLRLRLVGGIEWKEKAIPLRKGLSVGGCGIAFPFSPDLRFLQKLSDALASISCSATELQPLTIDLQSTPRFLFFFFFSISGKRGLARFFSISGEDPRGLAPIETKKFSRGSILGSLRCCCCCFLDLHRCLTTAASWIFTGTKTSLASSSPDDEGGDNLSGGPLVSFVNGAWVDQVFDLKPSFEAIVKGSYKADIRTLDFVNKLFYCRIMAHLGLVKSESLKR